MIHVKENKTKFEKRFWCDQCREDFEINEIRYTWSLQIPNTSVYSHLTTNCDNCYKKNIHYLRDFLIDFTNYHEDQDHLYPDYDEDQDYKELTEANLLNEDENYNE